MNFRLAVHVWTWLCLWPAFGIAGPPNVVVILTDDQGWGDLSIHGNSNLSTPNIDALATEGARFDYFYVCAVCAPTRAEFLTGRYYPRTGVSGVSRGEGRLNPDETTIADVFHEAGYATGCFGKWHNGTQAPLHPNNRGFDEFYGFTSGHWGHYFSPPLDHNGQRVRGDGYVADDFTNRAITFIENHQDQPFFCYLPFNTPHSPMMVADRFYDKFKGVDPEMKHRDADKEDVMMTRAALAMCENIDWNVGRLLRRLDALNLTDNTIVVFFCDNGPNSWRWNGGMKGRKGSVDEGGLRSPCFIRWPAQIRGGTHLTGIAAAIDLLPTLTGLAGIPCRLSKQLDGHDLSGNLKRGESTPIPERVIYSVWQKKAAVSVRTQRFRLDPEGRLFEIAKDQGQRQDVSRRYPQETQKLMRLAKEFQSEVKSAFAASADRPFHVGYGKSTTLPARDGVPHGTIQRSSKAPNNSFFTHWTSPDDSITWDVVVAEDAEFDVTVWYTCGEKNIGCTVQLTADTQSVATQVAAAFNPPLYDKSLERVAESHYFVKDFQPLQLGRIRMKQGECTIRLSSSEIVGNRGIDVHSLDLVRVGE